MFSIPLLCSHATVCLVDHNHLQLYHTNNSIILVSSAINFSKDKDLDKFIAIIITFQCLSLKQNGILTALPKSNRKLVKNPNVPEDYKVIQNGNALELTAKGEQKLFKVILGKAIFYNPAVIGQSTVVLKATSKRWPQTNLVIKVSWLSSGQVLIKKATKEAKKTDEEWAMKHLPCIFFTEEVYFNKDSAFQSVAELFKNTKFALGDYVYEQWKLQIIIQEELYPLKLLSNVKDISQVFVDITCSMSPFLFLVTVHLPHSSSPLALQRPWNPSL